MTEEARGLQQVIPDTWEAFLGRFARPTPIQRVAIPALAAGGDALVVAPAASGKTEAVVAPLCQRLIRSARTPGPRFLYVVPTRALANDIEMRLREPCGTLGIRVALRTGDRPADLAGRETDLLVTTPESLDSILCRYPDRFAGLAALVLDEVHLLHRTCRGEQARILIRRIARWHCRGPVQRVALSATVGDPEALGGWLFGHPVPVLEAGEARPLDFRIAQDLEEAVRLLRQEGLSKALWFCNSRRRTEEVARALARRGPWPPERVLVHHASLSRKAREEAERAFRRYDACLMVATSTLEWGVDVGNVDAVVLVGAPESAASFIQRVGRGCRRRQGLRAIGIVESDEDRQRFSDLNRDLGRPPPEPESESHLAPAVAVQQVFSILYGRRQGVGRRELLDILQGMGPREDLEEILDHLIRLEWVVARGVEQVQASTRLMDLGERGRVHSNLGDDRLVQVADAATGRPLGQVPADMVAEGRISLGGRSWQVASRSGDLVRVVPSGPDAEDGSFHRRTSRHPFSRWLPDRLQAGFPAPRRTASGD
ncbi:MAG TPA: DEAD/DEAH box helicase [Myxococcota bacterium]|nr:DEAD/DEAH box helicase [Myxococcota bacterium]HQK51461.1 DEAD/DEAH box helicase [Myxococcota bacterium]